MTSLDLEWNEIGAGGMVKLAAALETNSTLTSLDVVGNQIGPEGAAGLAAALEKNLTLMSLDLRSNRIGPRERQVWQQHWRKTQR